MKKIIIFITTFLFAQDIQELLKMAKMLKKDTEYKQINNLYNPFSYKKVSKMDIIKVKKTTKQNNINYNLQAIFQNKAKINNVWYKNGDKLDKYIVVIKGFDVFLKYKNHIEKLTKQTYIKVKE